MEANVRVVVVEDEWVVGRNIRQVLESAGYHITAVIPAVREAIASLETDRPSLVLIDIHLADEASGIDVARYAGARGIPFIFVTAHCDALTLERAVESGPMSFAVKPFDGDRLIATVQRALKRAGAQTTRRAVSGATGQPSARAGLNGVRGTVLQRVAEAALDPQCEYERSPQLSRREFEVVRLLMDGHRIKSIAEKLGLSVFTVRKYLATVFRKLGVHSQSELLRELHAASDTLGLEATSFAPYRPSASQSVSRGAK